MWEWPIWAVMRRTWRLRPSTIYLEPAGGDPLRSRMGGLRGHTAGSSMMQSRRQGHAVIEFHQRAAAQFLLARHAFHLRSRCQGLSPGWVRRACSLRVVGEQRRPRCRAVRPARGIDAGLGDVILRGSRGPPRR